MKSWQILEGDCRDVLRTLPEKFVQTCVTSPPYFGLRDYGTSGQIGLEPTPDEFVAALVAVFRDVRRVLRDDGTVWCNLGDSYGPGKQLQGIPWRFALAMQEDGWVLRQEVVWQKPNPMPESVTDRCTRAHEQIFMFAKGRQRAGRFAHISEEDARWLALFVDTEGNISVKRGMGRNGDAMGIQVAVAGCSRPLLERAQAIVGAGNIHERPGTNSPVYYWQMSNKAAQDLLLRLYPHLIVKQRQARIGIYLESLLGRGGEAPSAARSKLLERLWETNKSCNSFGEPDLSWVPEPRVFLLSKSARYFYDADAVREAPSESTGVRWGDDLSKRRPDGLGTDAFVPGGNTCGVNPAGRNKRSVWTVATQPFSARALYGDGGRITSPDCPVHGGRPVPAAMAPDDARVDAPSTRTPGTDDRPAQAPQDGSVPTGHPTAPATEADSSDLLVHPFVGTAIPRSIETRKTVLGPGTSLPYTASARTTGRTGDTSVSLEQDALFDHTPENKSGPDDLTAHPSGQTSNRTARTASVVKGEKACSCKYIDHFATFPPKLIEPCVLAGSSPKACGVCRAPWRRVRGRDCRECGALVPTQAKVCEACGFRNTDWRKGRTVNGTEHVVDASGSTPGRATPRFPGGFEPQVRTEGWESSCDHQDDTGSSVVLDPFAGAGTTGLVALRHGRSFLGIELNPEYAQLARDRIETDLRLGHRPPQKAPDVSTDHLSLFDV